MPSYCPVRFPNVVILKGRVIPYGTNQPPHSHFRIQCTLLHPREFSNSISGATVAITHTQTRRQCPPSRVSTFSGLNRVSISLIAAKAVAESTNSHPRAPTVVSAASSGGRPVASRVAIRLFQSYQRLGASERIAFTFHRSGPDLCGRPTGCEM